MRVHQSGIGNCSKLGPTKIPVARIITLGFFLAVLTIGSSVSPAGAQLGIPGFSFFDGIGSGRLGSASAAGDFNDDGFDDLAVGLPDADVGAEASAGAIIVFHGGPGNWSGSEFIVSETLGGVSEAGARFGSALTTGDFDDDGHDDLVIGVPGRTVSGADSAGEIAVAYGNSISSAGGTSQGPPPVFDVTRTQFFSQVPLPGAPEEDDGFGSSLAAGDLSADGVDDLAIGVHLEDIQGPLGLREDVGAVNVMYGVSGVGLTATGSQLINQNSPGVGLNANAGEHFGFSLAIGQLIHNANTDLAVGAPGEAVFGAGQQGAVVIFPGAPGGLDPVVGEEAVWSQRTDGILGTEEDGDEFGYSLAVGNFDGDLFMDLAIGVPGEAELGTTESGAVQVLYGNAVGLTTTGDQFFVESSFDVDVDQFDRLGEALAVGDFNADGRDDLAMGAPLDNSLGFTNAGEVDVLYGTTNGLVIPGGQVFDMIFFDTLEAGDLFGFALTAGRFFSDTYHSQDLAVGIPRRGEPFGSEPGAVVVIRSQSIFTDDFQAGNTDAWSLTVP